LALENDCPRSIPKQDTGVPVAPIGEGGEGFGTHEENGSIHPGSDKVIRDGETIDEP
jgi:hypothetical protein